MAFVDFDGVLCGQWMERLPTPTDMHLDPSRVGILDAALAVTGCGLVVSSTWRDLGLKFCAQKLREAGFRGVINGMTPKLHGPRWMEIDAWMNRQGRTVDGMVVIDDDVFDLKIMRSCLVEVDPKVGFTEENGRQVRKLMEQQEAKPVRRTTGR